MSNFEKKIAKFLKQSKKTNRKLQDRLDRKHKVRKHPPKEKVEKERLY